MSDRGRTGEAPDGSGPVPRRVPRSGGNAAPVSGGLAMVLAAIAMVAGFFILRSISDGGEQSLDVPSLGDSGVDTSGGANVAETTTTVVGIGGTTTTTSTVPPLVTTGASVIVANANGQSGTAATMSEALELGPKFTMVEPTDTAASVPDIDVSVVYYVPSIAGAQAVAESLNTVLGGRLQVSPLQGTAPVADGDMRGAGVLLMLGRDLAGKTLDEIAAQAGAAPTVTNPPVSGGVAPATSDPVAPGTSAPG